MNVEEAITLLSKLQVRAIVICAFSAPVAIVLWTWLNWTENPFSFYEGVAFHISVYFFALAMVTSAIVRVISRSILSHSTNVGIRLGISMVITLVSLFFLVMGVLWFFGIVD